MSVSRVRVGVVGGGSIAKAHVIAVRSLRSYFGGDGRDPEVVVIADVVPEAAEQAARAYGVERWTADWRSLVEDDGIDLVTIAVPNDQHEAVAVAAARAGKHVLSEKPLATTLAEADELVELAARGPGLLVAAPFTLLSPTYQAIARRIQRGDIGKPCSARGRYGWSGPWWSEWFYRAGGGPVFDLACYNITSLTGWLGPVERVTALTGIAVPERVVDGKPLAAGVEDNAQILLDFGGSCFGAVTSGFTMQQYRSPALEVYGTDGTLQMLGDDWDPDGYEYWHNPAGCWQVYKETAPDWPWADGLRHAVECIRTGAKPLVTPEHARHVLEVMLAAHESGRDGSAKLIRSRFARPEFPDQNLVEPAHLMHDRSRKELDR
jgi:predicted dehydrogenase